MSECVCFCSLIVLVALWGVAMLIGILVKRFAMGAKGWEQIPLLSWYKLFGELEAVSVTLPQTAT